MDDNLRATAERLTKVLRSFGASDHTVVGVGSTRNEDEQKVPALHIYTTPKDRKKLPQRLDAFEDVWVKWHVGGPARPLA